MKQNVNSIPSLLCFQMYYHGEPIKVCVNITNNSSKNIKNIIVSGKQDHSCLFICFYQHSDNLLYVTKGQTSSVKK